MTDFTEFIQRLEAAGAELHKDACSICSLDLALEGVSATLERASKLPDDQLKAIGSGLVVDALALQSLMEYKMVLESNKAKCACMPTATVH